MRVRVGGRGGKVENDGGVFCSPNSSKSLLYLPSSLRLSREHPLASACSPLHLNQSSGGATGPFAGFCVLNIFNRTVSYVRVREQNPWNFLGIVLLLSVSF